MINDNDFIILEKTEIYEPTVSGRYFKKSPVQVERTVISAKNYYYKVDTNTIKFFNWRDINASMRAYKNYTVAGYVTTRITTIAPHRAYRRVESYEILNKAPMIESAGYREIDILNRAVIFERDNDNCISFYTDVDETGHRDGAQYSLTLHRWIG